MSTSASAKVACENRVGAQDSVDSGDALAPSAVAAWRWCDEFRAGQRAPKLARAAVAAVCAPRYDRATVIDVQLVVSELVTNCIEHAGADCVRLCLSSTGSEIVVTVTSATTLDGLPEPSKWRLPDSNSRTGRGLAMIRRIGRPAVCGVDGAIDPGWPGVTVAIEPHPR